MDEIQNQKLTVEDILPQDKYNAILVGRAWVPGKPSGPSVILIREEGVFALSSYFPTMN